MSALPQMNASAAGALAERPFARLIVFLYRKGVTGRLAITEPSGTRSTIFLRRGVPVFVEHAAEQDRLDRVLVDSGIVTAKTLVEVERVRARTGRKLGEILEEMGVVDHGILSEGLRLQVRRKLQRLFQPQQGRFEVYLHDHEFGRDGEFERLGVEPPRVVYPGIRGAYDEPRLQRELAVVGGRIMRLGEIPPGFRLADMEFLPGDQAALTALRSRGLRLDEIAGLGFSPFDTKSVLLALLYTDLLRLAQAPADAPVATRAATALEHLIAAGNGSGNHGADHAGQARQHVDETEMITVIVDPTPRPDTPPPSWLAAARARPASKVVVAAPRAEVNPMRERILALYDRIDKLTLFETLEVPDGAPPSEVEAAYVAAVKRYHPDRLAATGLADLRPRVERILARMNEARNVLADPKKRDAYVVSLKYGEVERQAAKAALEAEFAFQKGESFLRRGDFARAEEAFSQSVQLNPGEPEHKALHAWARFSNPKLPKEATARLAVKTLREVLTERPKWARGFAFLGQVWKFLGDEPKAEGCFRNALDVDPRLYEAERELRLIEARRQQKHKHGGAAGKAGLFDRLKRK